MDSTIWVIWTLNQTPCLRREFFVWSRWNRERESEKACETKGDEEKRQSERESKKREEEKNKPIGAKS